MPKEKVKKIKLNQTLELFFRQKLIDKLIFSNISTRMSSLESKLTTTLLNS